MRRLVAMLVVIGLVGYLPVGSAAAEEPVPAPSHDPDDVATALPASIGDWRMDNVTYAGLDYLEQLKLGYLDQLGGLGSWRAVLAPLGMEPGDVQLAAGGPIGLPQRSAAAIWVIRVEGVSGSTVLDGLLAASAEGLGLADEVVVDDWSDSSAWDWAPLSALGIDTGLRPVDEIVVGDKDVVVVEDLAATPPFAPSYLFGYARGELLYLLKSRGPDAPLLDEMLGSLPYVGTGAAMAQVADTPGQARVVELEADAALRFTQDGEQIHDIPVVPGETVLFRIDNTAGFDHSFYVGTDSELYAPYAATDVGIPEWSSGVRELEWTVPEDISALKFGCTVPGHYVLMQGCLSEARVGPDGAVQRVAGAEACPLADLDSVSGIADEWRPGGRIEVPWAGIAVTFPDTWDVNVEPEPSGGLQPHVTVLFGASARGDSCILSSDPGSGFDWTTARARSSATVEVGGASVVRFDEVTPWGEDTIYRSVFVIGEPGRLLTVECMGFETVAPDWLSIAETIEFAPVEE